MKKLYKILISLLCSIILVVVLAISIYNINLKPVSNNTSEKIVEIKPGSIRTIAGTLKEHNLIRNELAFRLYIKLNNITNLKVGYYKLSEAMDTKEIIDNLVAGSSYNPNEINITFKEGLNIRKYAEIIEENTVNTKDSFIKLVNDKEFIDKLINDYWFLTSEINNDNIYYKLEGYLFPNTYTFASVDVTLEDIIYKLLNETDRQLSKYKDLIDKSNYSIHELLTLASIVELEGSNSDDRKGVAGVFYNRLNNNWSLGSDATTYYANKIDDWSYSLTYKELNNCNNLYNTRCNKLVGLPIGPISNPGIESIISVLEPANHNYFYFVADCTGKTYLSENSSEHSRIINTLKQEDNWCA